MELSDANKTVKFDYDTLIARATKAHRLRCLKAGGEPQQPCRYSSDVEEDGGAIMVVLRNVNGTLATYEYHPDQDRLEWVEAGEARPVPLPEVAECDLCGKETECHEAPDGTWYCDDCDEWPVSLNLDYTALHVLIDALERRKAIGPDSITDDYTVPICEELLEAIVEQSREAWQ